MIARVERSERFAYLLLADGRFIWKEDGFGAGGARLSGVGSRDQ